VSLITKSFQKNWGKTQTHYVGAFEQDAGLDFKTVLKEKERMGVGEVETIVWFK